MTSYFYLLNLIIPCSWEIFNQKQHKTDSGTIKTDSEIMFCRDLSYAFHTQKRCVKIGIRTNPSCRSKSLTYFYRKGYYMEKTNNNFIMLPTVDICFKNLMDNPDVRKGFIAALLRRSPDEISKTKLLPTTLKREYGNDKLGILDVLILLQDGRRLIWRCRWHTLTTGMQGFSFIWERHLLVS